MADSDSLQITNPRWFKSEAATPQLSDDETEPVLAFNMVPAQAQGPTVALLATYRVSKSGSYFEAYGSRIPGAVNIVAIDTTRGHIYHNNAESPDVIPLTAVMDTTSDKESNRSGTSKSYFNVDIAHQLRLPSQKATYDVLLWLDDFTTEIKTVTVPADPNRQGRSSSPQFGPQDYAIVFDDQLRVTSPKSDMIALEHTSEDPPVVIGSIGSDLLESRKAEQGESPVHLGVLGLCQQTRKVATRTRVVPEEMRAGGRASFRVNVHRFIECEAEEGPVYLLAYAGGAHSPVVTVDLS